MAQPSEEQSLPPTRMSMLLALAGGGIEQKLVGLGVFYQQYRSGMARCIEQRFGVSTLDAEEILHEFLVKKLLDGEFVAKYLEHVGEASSSQVRFRPFLVRSLCNFTLDWLRAKRPMLELQDQGHFEPQLNQSILNEWLQDLLLKTMQKTRSHYVSQGNELHWQLFLARSIEPVVHGTETPSHENLAARFGLESTKAASNVWVNCLRMLKKFWHQSLTESLQNESDDEIADVMREFRQNLNGATTINMRKLLLSCTGDESLAQKPGAAEREEEVPKSARMMEIFSLASDGFDRLMDCEKALLLECFLSAPLAEVTGQSEQTLSAATSQPTLSGSCSIGDLIAAERCDLELCRYLASHLKSTIARRSGEIPDSIAGTLRFLLIADVALRTDEKISQTPTDKLQRSIAAVLSESTWITGEVRELLQRFIKMELSGAIG